MFLVIHRYILLSLILLLFLANSVYAFARRVMGAGIAWKQRTYGRGSGVE